MRNLLNNSGAGSPLHKRIPKGDGVLYEVSWRSNVVNFSKIELPTQDLAEYYANTVTLYLGSMYCCYDHEAFMNNLREFYAEKTVQTQRRPRLWHIQMLLIFAWWKSILAREASPSGQMGMNFFAPAIEGMPDAAHPPLHSPRHAGGNHHLSLFLEASDIRSGAWGYVSEDIICCGRN